LPHIPTHTYRILRYRILQAEHAQTLAEYAILAGGIAVTVALTVPLIARSVTGLYRSAAGAFGG
jgi:Flp pilus assembly pilin Flp